MRRIFNVNCVDPLAEISVSADTDYCIWLNDKFVNLGQFSDWPREKHYDRIKVSDYLKVGRNCLSILAYYQGKSTHRYRKGKPGLIFSLKCGTKNIDRKHCSNCNSLLLVDKNKDGIPEYIQEAIQLECPWCKTFNKVIDETNCKNCGGPLPAIPHDNAGLDKGKPPGNPPRIIPKVYVKKLK